MRTRKDWRRIKCGDYRTMLAIGVAAFALSANATTVGHWRFKLDNVSDGAVVPADTVFENLVDKNTLPATLFAGKNTESYPAIYSNIVDRTWNAIREGASGMLLYEGNIGSVRTSGHPVYRSNTDRQSGNKESEDGYAIEIKDPEGLLKLQTFTLELLVRIHDSTDDDWTSDQQQRALFSMASGTDSNQHAYWMTARPNWHTVKGLIGDAGTEKDVITTVSGGGERLAMSDYHHIAFVVTNGSWQLFRDYSQWKDAQLAGGQIKYGDNGASLVIGGSRIANMFARMDVVEARFSDEALGVDKMLRRDCSYHAENGEALLYLPFDGSYASVSFPEMISSTPSVGVFDEVSSLPEFVSDVKNPRIVTGLGEAARIGLNEMSLSCKGGVAMWRTSDVRQARMLYGEKSFTVEFFLKCGLQGACTVVAAENTALLDKGRSANNDASWQFGFRGGNFVLRSLTDVAQAEKNPHWCIECPTNKLSNGSWHHVAATWENTVLGDDAPGDAETRITLYVDYVQVGETTARGFVYYKNDVEVPLYIGSYNPSTKSPYMHVDPFYGAIDELRVTKGVLPVEKFLRLKSNLGFLLLFR